jgi:hypothetical protein
MLYFVQQDAVLPRLRHHPPAFHDLADAVSGGFHLQLGSDRYVMQITTPAQDLAPSGGFLLMRHSGGLISDDAA